MESVNLEDKKYSAAIYMRLSKDDGDKEESESITNQRKILKAFVKENNYDLYKEYVDDGYSGTNFNRPAFKRMIKDINDGKINMVITKNLARLGRDYIETGRYIESFFPEREVRYIAILDDVDTFLDKNCDTVPFRNIVNDFFAKETSKNIKKTKNRKKKEGFYYISYAPFGYKKIDKAGNLIIDEVAANTVKKIFKEFLNGRGTYQIATLLNKEKVTTPGIQMNMTGVVNNITNTTSKWQHTTVKRILTNPVYIGTIVQNKRKKINYKSKKMVTLPEEQHTVHKNHHTPIIDKETWDSVQKKFANCEGEHIKYDDPLLKALLYCSHCHNKLQIITKKDKYKGYEKIRKYVICATAARKITNKICYKQYINYDKLENIVLEKISETFGEYIKVFNNDELLQNLINSKSDKSKIEEKLLQIENQLKNINKKISTLYNDKLSGLIEEQDFTLFSQGLTTERKKLEQLKDETEKELEDFCKGLDSSKIEEKVKETIKKIVESRQFKKEDLQQLINKIEIDKDKNINIYFNFYELNCIGGCFNYDDSRKKTVNS